MGSAGIWALQRKSHKRKTMRYSDGYSDVSPSVSLRRLSGLLHYFPPFCLVSLASQTLTSGHAHQHGEKGSGSRDYLLILVQWAGSCLFTCGHGLLWKIWRADRIFCSSEVFCGVKSELYLQSDENTCTSSTVYEWPTVDCLWTNKLFIGITSLKIVCWWKWGAKVSPVLCLK